MPRLGIFAGPLCSNAAQGSCTTSIVFNTPDRGSSVALLPGGAASWRCTNFLASAPFFTCVLLSSRLHATNAHCFLMHADGAENVRGGGGRHQCAEGMGRERAQEGRAVREGPEQAHLGGAVQGDYNSRVSGGCQESFRRQECSEDWE